jgi:hypothetical protein
MNVTRPLTCALAAALLAGCANSGSQFSPAASGLTAPAGSAKSAVRHRRKVKAKLVIKIRRHRRIRRPGYAKAPNYISPNTLSIGAVVTPNGQGPGAPAFVNVPGCPVVGDVATCTLVVAAAAGQNSFAVTAYSGQNGNGSALSTGTLVATIAGGASNVTEPLVLDGIPATIVLTPSTSKLPLGQTLSLAVGAQDASGSTIIGTYETPIGLSASTLTLGASTVADSSSGQSVKALWPNGFEGTSDDSIAASSGAASSSATIHPATGFAYYSLGNNQNYDDVGFQAATGPVDGKIYYATVGPTVCQLSGFCGANDGAIGRFDPTTHAFEEIELNSQANTPYFTSDNALWVGGGKNGTTGTLFHMPASALASAFTTSNLASVPLTNPGSGTFQIREYAQDANNKLWITDNGPTVLAIPVAASPDPTAVVSYPLPSGAAGTFGFNANSQGIAYGSDGNLYIADYLNGLIDQVSSATGAATNQFLLPQQTTLGASDSAGPRFIVNGPNNKLYLSYYGSLDSTINEGGISSLTLPSTFTGQSLPAAYNQLPWVFEIDGNALYYSDLGLLGLGYIDLATGKSRLYPMYPNGVVTSPRVPNGIAFDSNSSPWFTCFGAFATPQPLCMGHPIYLSGWSLWPSNDLELAGTGSQSSQIVGIMEGPSANSGPFTVQNSDSTVCSVTTPVDHNFVVTGVGPGVCTLTVKDAGAVTESMTVGVTQTNGTVTGRHPHHMGGLL